jgi:hypothetical protein
MNGKAVNAAEALVNTVRQRIESRYRRIRFVHQELAKLDAAAKENAGNAASLSNGSFEDFVFSRIDFSVYKKIDAEEFRLLFDEGLADYDEAFFRKAFNLSRDDVRSTIARSYIRVGPFFVSKSSGPLLLSIMRTLHSSLEFAPLLDAGDVPVREQLLAVAGVLDNIVIRHDDGMETRLFVPKADESTAPSTPAGTAILCGTFHPLNKAYTITLIPREDGIFLVS